MDDDGEHSEEVLSYYGSEDELQARPSSHAEEDGEDDASPSSSAAASAAPSEPLFHILTTQQLEQWVTANNQIDVGCAGNVVWSVSSAKHGNGVRHLMHCHDLNTFWQSDGVLPHIIRIRLGQLTPVEAIALYVNSAVDQSYSPRVMKVRAGTHEGDMTEVAKADIGAGQECGWVLLELGDRAESKHTNAEEAASQEKREKKRGRHARVSSGAVEVSAGATATAAATAPPLSYREVAAVLGNATAPAAAAAPASSLFLGSPQTVADRWLWCTVIDICICENQFNGRDCHLRGICLTGPRYEELERGLLEDSAGGGPARIAGASVKSILQGSSNGEQHGGGGEPERRESEDWLLR